MNISIELTPNIIDITEFGFTARFYKMTAVSSRDIWTVNFPQPLVSANQKTLEEYQLFIEFVVYYLQELNS